MMGVHYKKRDPHKVWIWKKMLALRRSMDLQRKIWWVLVMLWKIIMKYGFEEKNVNSETKYRYAKKKIMGVHYKKRDPHEVWIWKKKMALRRSMDLQRKKWWVFVMLWKIIMKYGFEKKWYLLDKVWICRKKMMGVHYKKRDPHKVWI